MGRRRYLPSVPKKKSEPQTQVPVPAILVGLFGREMAHALLEEWRPRNRRLGLFPLPGVARVIPPGDRTRPPGFIYRIDNQWVAAGFVEPREGEVILSALLILPELSLVSGEAKTLEDLVRLEGAPVSAPHRGITSTVLRSIRTSDLLAAVLRALRTQPDSAHMQELLVRAVPKWAEDSAHMQEFLARPRPTQELFAGSLPKWAEEVSTSRGRPRTPPEVHFERAKNYLDLQNNEHILRGIVPELAKRWNVPPGTARDWIHAATKAGFLSRGTPGRAGRMPGPRYFDFEKRGRTR
jgi:hypothetical protein